MIRLIRFGVEGYGVALTPQTERHFRLMLVLIGVERLVHETRAGNFSECW
jgi:hypothetical protein